MNDCQVALLPCPDYNRPAIKAAVEQATAALGLDNLYGRRVLVKPNCISAGRQDGLACTHPEFVAACVEWLVDMGARVTVGKQGQRLFLDFLSRPSTRPSMQFTIENGLHLTNKILIAAWPPGH